MHLQHLQLNGTAMLQPGIPEYCMVFYTSQEQFPVFVASFRMASFSSLVLRSVRSFMISQIYD
jgi:hypothetical protein